jgi:hypothetical protein
MDYTGLMVGSPTKFEKLCLWLKSVGDPGYAAAISARTNRSWWFSR